MFSLTTTTAAIPALAHLSQRANEEDSGPAHVCFRSQAICCKCVCGGRQWVPGACMYVCVQVHGRKEVWLTEWLSVWSVKAMYNTDSSFINNNLLCDTFSPWDQIVTVNEDLVSLTMEASVCAWLVIDHMVLTRVEPGRMTAEDDDLIPHPMLSAWGFLSLAVSRSCFRASPTEHQWGGSILKVSQAPVDVCVGGGVVGVRIPPSTHPQVLVTLWMWAQPTVPRIHPSRAFFVLMCHTAAVLSVCKYFDIPVYPCVSGWLGIVHVRYINIFTRITCSYLPRVNNKRLIMLIGICSFHHCLEQE